MARHSNNVGAMDGSVAITGDDLDPEALVAIARQGAAVVIEPRARERMRAAAAVVRRAAEAGAPVYGVTTGLGPRVVQRLAEDELAAFSLATIRGRAMAVGEPLSAELTRAAMAVRLNGLCAGGAGAGEAIADGLAALLNARVHPVIPASGSIGAADLCLLAHVGLTLIGEGEAELGGELMPSAGALARAGLKPVALGPKDGLAICSSSAVSVGAAALALVDAEGCLAAAQVAAALSMEGFRANLTPLDPRVVAARPAPGQAWAAAGLRALLAGGTLTEPGAARRLQDPLSFRCASQIHGALRVALGVLGDAVAADLAGAADNPLVLADDEEILSTGNFHVPALALALDSVAIALAQVAAPMAERQARLKTARLSGLEHNLTTESAARSGLGPLSKTADALVIEIRHAAAPFAVHPAVGSDGVEDDSTGAVQAALRVHVQLARLRRLIALELVVAAQAVTLASPPRLGAGTEAAYATVRETVAALGEDRPLGPEVERLSWEALATGRLMERVHEAIRA
jgi:histidine ammonia-lyase